VSRHREHRALILICLAFIACANLDGFIYNPKHVEHYDFSYGPSVPSAWQAPAALRRELTLHADGSVVYAVMLLRPAAERASAPSILYHHGNKFGIDEYWLRASHLWSLGMATRSAAARPSKLPRTAAHIVA